MRQAILILLTLLLFACGGNDATSPDTPPAPSTATAPAAAPLKTYPTATVSIGNVKRPIRLTGRVVPLQEATVSSQVPGIVLPTNKLLQEGKFYAKGETMIRIDNKALRLGLIDFSN